MKNILKFIKWPFKLIWWICKFYWWCFFWPYYLYRYLKGYRFGNIKCPNCKNWIEKPDVLTQKYLGKKTIQESKSDVHYISEGYFKKNVSRINHRYKVDKEVDYYRNSYKCIKCNDLFYLDEY